MANRRKSNGREPSAPEPFNNPFRTDLRKLKRRVRATAAAAAPAGARDTPVETPSAPRADDELFRDAVDGAVPLGDGGRVRPGGVPRSRSVRATDEDSRIDFTADEHFDVRFSDRFIRGRAAGVSRETLRKLEHGEFAVRSHVDLHGMALDDAKRTVDEFLADCQRRGDRCVLLITGKGRNSRHQVGVLREKIPEWLARGPSARRLLAFVTARPCDGGEGAFYVLLRTRASRKIRIDVEAGGGA